MFLVWRIALLGVITDLQTRHNLVASTLYFSLSYLLHKLLMTTYEYLSVLLGVITDLYLARQDMTHSCGHYSVLFPTCGLPISTFYYFWLRLNTFLLSFFQWLLGALVVGA